jgi:hypothetical protein
MATAHPVLGLTTTDPWWASLSVFECGSSVSVVDGWMRGGITP